MVSKDLNPEIVKRVDSWRGGFAVGTIESFEWFIGEVTGMAAGGHITWDAIVRRAERELDRRYPLPDPRRGKRK